MGILDDAIRDHLELKRRHGASDLELQVKEEEAFGPARAEAAAAPVEEPPPVEVPEEEPPPVEEPEPELPPVEAPEPPAEPEPGPEPVRPVHHHHDDDELHPALHDHRRIEGEDEPPDPVFRDRPLAAEAPAAREAPPPPGAPLEPAPVDDPPVGDPAVEYPDEDEPPPRQTPDEHGEHDTAAEDVLEETPEFLQDAPEHDRLWFEQKPPRDFDFGD